MEGMSNFTTAEFQDFEPIMVCLIDFQISPDGAMIEISDRVGKVINQAIEEKCDRVEVKWVNIYERDENPDVKIGKLLIRGFRSRKTEQTQGAFGMIAPEDRAAFESPVLDAAGDCAKRVEAEQANG